MLFDWQNIESLLSKILWDPFQVINFGNTDVCNVAPNIKFLIKHILSIKKILIVVLITAYTHAHNQVGVLNILRMQDALNIPNLCTIT